VRAVTSTDESTELELEVGNIAGGGGCVARDPEGRVVFVRHSLPGERVKVRITSTTTSYRRANAIEILDPSPDRVDPPCPHAGPGRCGGCDFQHVSLAAQRRLKAFRIAEQLERVAGVTRSVEVEPVAGDTEGLGWRSRIRLAADAEGRVGFRRHRSHDLEYVTECPIAHPAVIATGALEVAWPKVEELEVIVSPGGTDALVSLDTTRKVKLVLPSVQAGVVAHGSVLRQPGAIHTMVDGITFRITAGVFWQVHVGAAAALSDAVQTALDAQPGDAAVDLYAGAGLFSVQLARQVGRKGSVLAVERDLRACGDAEHNGKGLKQLRVKKASVSPKVIEQGIGRPALLVLDPAREGAGKAVMHALAEHAATLRRLVYVSCDAGSFSRDCRVLLDQGWTLESLRAFDIFPMTEHVELVGRLSPPT
jgi:tRNA/tmRNA/rRNA uracil-C5-methylase (TrmA/RlmC/RlmD family)